jgi:hypothetical protein
MLHANHYNNLLKIPALLLATSLYVVEADGRTLCFGFLDNQTDSTLQLRGKKNKHTAVSADLAQISAHQQEQVDNCPLGQAELSGKSINVVEANGDIKPLSLFSYSYPKDNTKYIIDYDKLFNNDIKFYQSEIYDPQEPIYDNCYITTDTDGEPIAYVKATVKEQNAHYTVEYSCLLQTEITGQEVQLQNLGG